jgi:hypothetical protein
MPDNNKKCSFLVHYLFNFYFIFQMPAVVIERSSLPTEMRDALKKHILRERQRKKEEADANEADKQRRREEKVFKFFYFIY